MILPDRNDYFAKVGFETSELLDTYRVNGRKENQREVIDDLRNARQTSDAMKCQGHLVNP